METCQTFRHKPVCWWQCTFGGSHIHSMLASVCFLPISIVSNFRFSVQGRHYSANGLPHVWRQAITSTIADFFSLNTFQCDLKRNTVNFNQQMAFDYRWFDAIGTWLLCVVNGVTSLSLRWRHVTNGVSNYRQLYVCSAIYFVIHQKISKLRIAGPLWRESTVDRWIALIKSH